MPETIAPLTLAAVRTADDVTAEAIRIFGDLPAPQGVLQVMACHRRDGALLALATGEGAPRCDEDAFALALARARADAIITTGAILREEPALSHAPEASTDHGEAMAAWRSANGRQRPATTVVMTRSRDIDLDHPVFHGNNPVLVFTNESAPPSFGIELAARGGMLITEAEPTLQRCIARLQQTGSAAITVEAGPSTAAKLFEPPVLIDELLLTTLDAAALDPAYVRGELIREDALATRLRSTGPAYEARDGDHTWRLQRWVR